MDNAALHQALLDQLRSETAAPFLFVGSGMSRRYLGLPSWEELLERFTEQLPHPYSYYRATADGHLPRVASLIAADFHEFWWSQPGAGSADPLPAGPQSALKFEISRYLSEHARLDDAAAPAVADTNLAEEVELLRRAVIDGVITTNYDTLLSQVFEEFHLYVGQEGLLFSDAQGIAETYHIHGSVTAPESLVLTGEDYTKFDDRNAYLAAKLLTLFAEHPVVFLGYSLTDRNITAILDAIIKCLTTEKIGQLANRLIVVEWDAGRADPSINAASIVIDTVQIPVTLVQVSDYRPVFGALAELRRTFPAALLRQLKDHVHRLILSPPGEVPPLVVADIDGKDPAGLKVVFGVGAYDPKSVADLGCLGVTRANIVDDVLKITPLPVQAESILTLALPEILRRSPTTYAPVWKYMREAGRIADDGTVNVQGLDERVRRAVDRTRKDLGPTSYYVNRFTGFALTPSTPSELNAMGLSDAVNLAPLLDPAGYRPQELLQVLAERKPECGPDTAHTTAFHKAVCVYDLLNYGPS